jgi:hypothetical protein
VAADDGGIAFLGRSPRFGSRAIRVVAATIHPEALEEPAQAIGFYEEFEPPVRCLSLARFPFGIVYRSTSRGVRILAVMHQRRKPGCWQRRS